MKMSDVPVLPGWVSLPVAATRLEVTRQRLFQMADEEKLTTIHQIPGAGKRPAAYVIAEDEVVRLEREQEAARAASRRTEDERVPVGV
jgi:Holliday junction resolvasome RuvABC DNA-binding subunit